jgi:hypothetical protein
VSTLRSDFHQRRKASLADIWSRRGVGHVIAEAEASLRRGKTLLHTTYAHKDLGERLGLGLTFARESQGSAPSWNKLKTPCAANGGAPRWGQFGAVPEVAEVDERHLRRQQDPEPKSYWSGIQYISHSLGRR